MTLRFPLTGERLALRPFTSADVEAAHRVYGDPEVMRFVGEGVPVDRATTARMLEQYGAHQQEHGFAFWAVLERVTGALIGDAGLEVTEHGVELGYTLARESWGRGHATEAGRLCVTVADGPLDLPRLVALADLGNPASAVVLQRLGFAREQVVEAYGRPHQRFVRER